MVMLIDSVRAHLMRGWLFPGGCDVKRVLRARDPDVDDAPALPDRQRQRQVAFETPRELKNLAQVEQRARAAVALRAQLGPAQVSTLLEQAVEDIGHGQRVAQAADAVGQLDQAHRLRPDLWLHLRKSLAL